MSKSHLDNDYGCIMTLQHPKHPFPAIYWCSGQFRPLWKKSIFCQKITIFRIFGHFSHDLTSGRKWPETAIPHENTFSESQTYFCILRKSISIMEIIFSQFNLNGKILKNRKFQRNLKKITKSKNFMKNRNYFWTLKKWFPW